jgi:hypothetical protein
MRFPVAAAVMALLPVTAFGQAMVESAILSGAAAGAASGSAKATGRALSNSLGKLNSALGGKDGTSAKATPKGHVDKTGTAPAIPKPPHAAFEGVETGTPRAEVIAKAGKPQFAISSSDYEMLSYATAEGGSVRIQVVDGKVSKIEQTPPPPAPEAQPAPPVEPAKAPPPPPEK